MTISLEQLADGSVSDRNFQKLMALVPDAGGRSVGIRYGTGSVVFTASATSASTTIAHGLGATPQALTFGVYNNIVIEIISKSATNFVVQGWAPGGATTATLPFDWMAIG